MFHMNLITFINSLLKDLKKEFKESNFKRKHKDSDILVRNYFDVLSFVA